MEVDTRSEDFVSLLVEICKNINGKDLKNIKFLYDEYFEELQLESIVTAQVLLKELKDKNIISINNIKELKEIVEICMNGNNSLLQKIKKIEQSASEIVFVTNQFSKLHATVEKYQKRKFKILLLKLAEQVKKNDFQTMKLRYTERATGIRMEDFKYPIDLFKELYSQQILTENNIDQLEMMLKMCTNKNPTLLQMIEKYKQEIEDETGDNMNTAQEDGAQSSLNITSNPPRDVPDELTIEPTSEKDSHSSSLTPSRDLNKETELLVNNLGKSYWLFIEKLNGSDEIKKLDEESGDIKHVISNYLTDWLSKCDNADEKIRKDWIIILKEIARHDLVFELEKM